MTEPYITILENQIPFSDERRETSDLKYYEQNPRVLSKLIRAGKLNGSDEERQKAIEEGMPDESSVKILLRDIKLDGGISEPLIVHSRTLEVLEGNSRLAALRILYQRHQEEIYLSAPCRMVDLEEEEIDAFLYQQHIQGKTPWSAYDKAYSAYHRVEIDGVSIEEYSRRTKTTEVNIRRCIDVIKLMKSEGAEAETEKFSYYNEIVRSSKLNRSFNDAPELKRFLLDRISEPSPPFKAQEMRDKVPQIAVKPKALKKWISGSIDFDDAVTQSKISQPKQHALNATRNLKGIEKAGVERLSKNEKNVLMQEMKKCKREIKRIEKIIQDTEE